ncbi:MAG: RidA family protein [Chlorobiaceae bacterium]|nr:RidA family protein [Chlorobiaceae bacterium]
MNKKYDVKEQARDIIEENLDMEAVIYLGTISDEMQRIFTSNPTPSLADVTRIVTDYFTGDGRQAGFIEDWLRTAEEHSATRGLDEVERPKAILSDLGVFRFMWFLKERGLTEEQINIVLTGAVQQATGEEGE